MRHGKNMQLADFQYLKSQVSAASTPKVTIPSPTRLHFPLRQTSADLGDFDPGDFDPVDLR